MGIDEQEQEQLLREWHWFVKHQYINLILKGCFREGLTPQQAHKPSEFTNWNQVADPDELESYLSEIGFLSEVKKQLVQDYRYYLKIGKHRRPEVWKSFDLR